MGEFRRQAKNLVSKLESQKLFTERLMPDIEKGEVFFAIRDGYCSFYYKGCSLFKYDGKSFSTHYKYAFVPARKKTDSDYIDESSLGEMRIVTCFYQGYQDIKKQAKLYAKEEATGVSTLYKNAPRRENIQDRYFLVDIEIAFDATNDIDDKKNDRIDILLYDNIKRELLFCEAKHFSNKELWSKSGKKPSVVQQIIKYNRQIEINEKMIISEYTEMFKEYNSLMRTDLKAPKEIQKSCGLYVFGYDGQQQKKLNQLLIDDGSLDGYKYRFIGNPQKGTIKSLFEELAKSD